MEPTTPEISTPVPEIPSSNPKTPDRHWVTIASMALFVLLSLSAVVFLYYQNQQLKGMLARYQATPTPISAPTPNPNQPVVTSPPAGTKVISPLKITGVVPAGWMFEGTFPIKLTDSTGKMIVQGNGKEVTPGSWQSGNPVDFTATLTFKTASTSGFLVLENDNPSGNPANSKTFKIPLGLNCSPRPACLDENPRCLIPETSDMCPPASTPAAKACTQEAKICPDGSAVGRTGPNCEFAPCPSP